MKNEARLINAGSPVKFTDKDGLVHEFVAQDMGDRDIIELDEWVQAHYIEVARNSLPPNATDSERKETLGIAMDRAVGLSWCYGPGVRMMSTPAGWAQIAWRLLRKNHPELTLARITELMYNEANQQQASAKLSYFAARRSLPPAKKNSATTSRKKRPSRRNKSTKR